MGPPTDVQGRCGSNMTLIVLMVITIQAIPKKKIFDFLSVSDEVPQLIVASFQNHFGYVENTVCQDLN